MNMRQLEVFREVMVRSSVSGAAAHLNVSQPAISRTIKDLEHATGLKLFNHQRGRLSATQDAISLLAEIERTQFGMNYLRRAVEEIRAGHRVRLRIASFPALAQSHLPQIVTTYQQQFPHAAISIDVMPSLSVIENVATGQSDIGITARPAMLPNVRVYQRYSGACVCVLRRDHPLGKKAVIELGDLRNLAMVLFDANSQIASEIQRLQTHSSEARASVEVNLASTACQLVRAGKDATVIDPLTASTVDTDLIVRPLVPEVPFEFFIIVASSQHPSRPAKEFLEILDGECSKAIGC